MTHPPRRLAGELMQRRPIEAPAAPAQRRSAANARRREKSPDASRASILAQCASPPTQTHGLVLIHQRRQVMGHHGFSGQTGGAAGSSAIRLSATAKYSLPTRPRQFRPGSRLTASRSFPVRGVDIDCPRTRPGCLRAVASLNASRMESPGTNGSVVVIRTGAARGADRDHGTWPAAGGPLQLRLHLGRQLERHRVRRRQRQRVRGRRARRWRRSGTTAPRSGSGSIGSAVTPRRCRNSRLTHGLSRAPVPTRASAGHSRP